MFKTCDFHRFVSTLCFIRLPSFIIREKNFFFKWKPHLIMLHCRLIAFMYSYHLQWKKKDWIFRFWSVSFSTDWCYSMCRLNAFGWSDRLNVVETKHRMKCVTPANSWATFCAVPFSHVRFGCWTFRDHSHSSYLI